MIAPRIAIPMPASTDRKRNNSAWSQYASAIEQAGGIAVPAPLDETQEALARIASSCAGVLLPGSGADIDPERYGEQPIAQCAAKDPAREAADDLLLQDSFNLRKPIFGICYGLQSLNVWRNGTLIQDLPNHRARASVSHAHPVTLNPGSRLASIMEEASDVEHMAGFSQISVNSTHHQAVARPGDQLRVAARSPADGVIEALEADLPGQFVVGVQWHPERIYRESPASRALFAAFVQASAKWRPQGHS